MIPHIAANYPIKLIVSCIVSSGDTILNSSELGMVSPELYVACLAPPLGSGFRLTETSQGNRKTLVWRPAVKRS